jgi:Anti-sigma-28 factor, FlgM
MFSLAWEDFRMKVGPMSTHLHLVCVEAEQRSETLFAHEVGAPAWTDAVSSLEDRGEVEHGIHAEQWWHEDRAARVQLLRARVKSGTYRVDSIALAECILKDDVHLIEG